MQKKKCGDNKSRAGRIIPAEREEKKMKTYKIRFDTSTEKDAVEYIDAYTAQEARDKLSEKHPGIFNVEIIERLG